MVSHEKGVCVLGGGSVPKQSHPTLVKCHATKTHLVNAIIGIIS